MVSHVNSFQIIKYNHTTVHFVVLLVFDTIPFGFSFVMELLGNHIQFLNPFSFAKDH